MQKTVPLASLSIADLHGKAADLRKMAETARTQDTRDALLRLAARYAQLAQARMAESNGADGRINAWRLLPPARRDDLEAFTD